VIFASICSAWRLKISSTRCESFTIKCLKLFLIRSECKNLKNQRKQSEQDFASPEAKQICELAEYSNERATCESHDFVRKTRFIGLGTSAGGRQAPTGPDSKGLCGAI